MNVNANDEPSDIEDDDDESEEQDLRGRWELDPETVRHAREMRQNAQQALKNLVNACRSTVDVNVATASAVYETTKAVCSKLSGVEGKGKGAKLP